MVGRPKRVLKASRLEGLRGPVAPQVLCVRVCMCRVRVCACVVCMCHVRCVCMCECAHTCVSI